MLSQDKTTVNELKHILKDYDFLQYDERRSCNKDHLHVKVTCLNADRDLSVAVNIRRRLTQALNRYFINVFVGRSRPSWSTKWTSFYITECKSLSAYM
jgi:hypothetical protein